MREAGSPSWGFVVSVSEMLHAALFVRDALGLEVARGPGIPPRVAWPVPRRGQVLGAEVRAQAGLQWPSWWRAILAEETRQHRESHAGGEPDYAAWMAGQQRTGAAPEFTALCDQPGLREAVLATYAEARGWAGGPRRAWRAPAGGAGFGGELTRQAAEEVAFDRGVGVEVLYGMALVLAVEGPWWELVEPGVAACSHAAARDPGLAQRILRGVFASGLGR